MEMSPAVLRQVVSELRAESNGEDIVVGPTVQDDFNNHMAWGSGVIVGGKDNGDPQVRLVCFGKVASELEPYDPFVKDADDALVLRPADEITRTEAEQHRQALVRALCMVFKRVAEMDTELEAARLALALWPSDDFHELVVECDRVG